MDPFGPSVGTKKAPGWANKTTIYLVDPTLLHCMAQQDWGAAALEG